VGGRYELTSQGSVRVQWYALVNTIRVFLILASRRAAS
jgi:hypothetical protein